MNQEELYQLIEEYLQGSLSEAQRKEVEKRMTDDPGFRQEVELQKELMDTFQDPARMALRSTLASMMEEAPNSPNASPKDASNNWKNWLGLFFGILILALVGWKWLLPAFSSSSAVQNEQIQELPEEVPPTDPTDQIDVDSIKAPNENLDNSETEALEDKPTEEPEEPRPVPQRKYPVADLPSSEESEALIAMAVDLYDSSSPSISLSTRSTRKSDLRSRIERNFNEGKQSAVIAALDSLEALDNNELRMLAHAYFKDKQFEKASSTFLQIMEKGDNALTEDVEYYFLLSLLAESRQEESLFKEKMEQILAEPDRVYYDETLALKDKLANR